MFSLTCLMALSGPRYDLVVRREMFQFVADLSGHEMSECCWCQVVNSNTPHYVLNRVQRTGNNCKLFIKLRYIYLDSKIRSKSRVRGLKEKRKSYRFSEEKLKYFSNLVQHILHGLVIVLVNLLHFSGHYPVIEDRDSLSCSVVNTNNVTYNNIQSLPDIPGQTVSMSPLYNCRTKEEVQ